MNYNTLVGCEYNVNGLNSAHRRGVYTTRRKRVNLTLEDCDLPLGQGHICQGACILSCTLATNSERSAAASTTRPAAAANSFLADQTGGAGFSIRITSAKTRYGTRCEDPRRVSAASSGGGGAMFDCHQEGERKGCRNVASDLLAEVGKRLMVELPNHVFAGGEQTGLCHTRF